MEETAGNYGLKDEKAMVSNMSKYIKSSLLKGEEKKNNGGARLTEKTGIKNAL